MKNDPGSNFNIEEVFAAASQAAATVTTNAIDHAKAQSGAFAISCGTFATSFVATLQYSDNNVDWTDEPDAMAGNDLGATLTAAGDALVKVPNPRGRYTRLSIVLGGTCVFAVVGISGPKLNVTPAATTM